MRYPPPLTGMGASGLARLHAQHRFFEHRIRLVQRGFGNEAKIAAGRRAGVLGIVHGKLRKIGAGVQFLLEDAGFLAGFGFGSSLVVLAIVHGRIGVRGDDDLGDAVLGFSHVELRAILVIKVGDVLVGDGDFREDFAVKQLFDR